MSAMGRWILIETLILENERRRSEDERSEHRQAHSVQRVLSVPVRPDAPTAKPAEYRDSHRNERKCGNDYGARTMGKTVWTLSCANTTRSVAELDPFVPA